MTIKEVSEQTGLSQHTLRYYERVGMIPEVTRTTGGTRDYQEEDMKWVQLAKCMRSAGLPIEVMIEYLKLFQQGDETIPARLLLLKEQMKTLEEQKQAIQETMDRLAYKIEHYEQALVTGKLEWKKRKQRRNNTRKKLVVFYSRADENYFGGQYKYIDVGNTEKVADILA